MSWQPITVGTDLKLKGKTSRYRVVSWRGQWVTVQRHHPTTFRPQGHPITRRFKDFEAMCTGRAWEGSEPMWSRIVEWMELPREPGEIRARLQPTKQQLRDHAATNVLVDMEA